MKLNVLTPVRNLAGVPLKISPDANSEDMLLADVLETAALCQAPQGKTYNSKQQILRYELALNTFKARSLEPPEIEISAEVASEIKDDVSRIYLPIVAGQVLRMLDGR